MLFLYSHILPQNCILANISNLQFWQKIFLFHGVRKEKVSSFKPLPVILFWGTVLLFILAYSGAVLLSSLTHLVILGMLLLFSESKFSHQQSKEIWLYDLHGSFHVENSSMSAVPKCCKRDDKSNQPLNFKAQDENMKIT